jgi:hypothetical protein
MKYDCPHCRKSLEGKFIRLSRVEQVKMRSCPHCGREIEHLVHSHEVFTRVLTIFVAIATCYWIAQRGFSGMLTPLATGLAVLAAAYGIERYRLRDAPRYRKGRNEGWKPKLEPLE